MSDIEAEEGQNITLTCTFIPGNPVDTTVTWTRENDDSRSYGRDLIFKNVSRKDGVVYTCTVNNTMIMTGGIAVDGQSHRNINLNVLYEAKVIKYYVLGHDVNDSVTVLENHLVSFVCDVEGNPVPTGNIYNNNQLDMEKNINSTQTYARFSAFFVATCLHEGVYTCKGINKYNKKYSEANITLYVRCSPRPNASENLREIITTAENISVSLNFTATARPYPTIVAWKKLNGSSWITIHGSNNIKLYQSGLEFSLTIIRVSQPDFGQYKLRLGNSVGFYEHIFNVEPEGTITEKDNMVASSYTTAFVGVGIGACVTTLIIVGSAFFIYRYLRRRQRHLHDVQNRSSVQTEKINNEAEYDQIPMSNVNRGNFADDRIGSVRETESSQQYETLDESQKEGNDYSQIQAMHEERDDTARERKTCRNIGDKKKYLDSPDYINIRV